MSEITFTGEDFSSPITHVGLYSDSTPMVKVPNFDEIVARATGVTVRPSTLMSFMTAMMLVDSINAKGGWIKRLVLPYVPGARQDRINPTGDVLFTAAAVAGMINQRNFGQVIILDPHSPVTTHLIDRAIEYPLIDVAERLWHGYGGVIAPDKGAEDRSGLVAAVLDVPLVQAYKNRDVSTGRLSGFDVEVEAGKHYLVADDICDGGGTFIGLGEKIKEQGAYADLFVSHGIFSKGTVELKKFYKNIYTTDSREIHVGRSVSVIPIVKDMENYR